MKTFKEFIDKPTGTREEPGQLQHEPERRESAIQRALFLIPVHHFGAQAKGLSPGVTVARGLSPKVTDAIKFAQRVNVIVESSEFIGTLSDAIGTPRTGETEDEFVSRTKNAMAILPEKKLGT